MPRTGQTRFSDPTIWYATGVTLATLTFGLFQNQGHLVGGDISPAKTLWLNLTILCFIVLPGVWWRDRRVPPRMRSIFGVIFIAFVVRAAVELPILYLTDWWRCSYGIAHDLAVAVVAVAMVVGARGLGRHGTAFLWFIVALLLVEAAFAYAFCSVADPASGTYFAGADASFDGINRATWIVVGAAYPVLVILLWRRVHGATNTP